MPPPEGKIFGFNSTLWQHTAIDESVLDQAVGATVQRFTVDWKSLQPTATDPPVPAYAPGAAPTGTYLYKLDGIYSRLTAAGVTPLFNFLDAPTWATDYASCGLLDTACKNAASGGMLFPNAAHIQAWKSFVGAVASRYPEAIIEPWNEPNLVNYWKPTAPDPAYMTTLQCAAYQTVKALPAPNTVTSPGLGGFSRARTDGSQMFRTYATTMYQDGLRGCMDVLSVHTYGGANGPLGAGSLFAEEMRDFRGVRAAFGDTQPFWITETGTESSLAGEPGQQDRNVKLYNRLMTMPDVAMVLFYALREANTQPEDGKPQSGGYTYGFLHEDLTVKPVWCAFVTKAGRTYNGC